MSGRFQWENHGMRWPAYDNMTRLEQKMFWAVRESAMLQELPMPEVDGPGTEQEVEWPAEDPSDCAEVVLAWFDAGLVGVMKTETQEDVPGPQGRELLADYNGWGTRYSLCITDAGEAVLT